MSFNSRKLLLISNSVQFGRGYLDHVEPELRDLLGSSARVLFVPYALHDRDAYAEIARKKFESLGYSLDSIHGAADPRQAVENAQALFIGGGNTFRLLKTLYENGLLDPIRRRVDAGMPYIGSSAGSIVACPTIRTTNDMPIVEPPSLTALGLIPFQLNCHYLDPDPNSKHMGETREVRLREFHEENELPVVGLREGGFLRMDNGAVVLKGGFQARIFCRNQLPVEVQPEQTLNSFLAIGAAG